MKATAVVLCNDAGKNYFTNVLKYKPSTRIRCLPSNVNLLERTVVGAEAEFSDLLVYPDNVNDIPQDVVALVDVEGDRAMDRFTIIANYAYVDGVLSHAYSMSDVEPEGDQVPFEIVDYLTTREEIPDFTPENVETYKAARTKILEMLGMEKRV